MKSKLSQTILGLLLALSMPAMAATPAATAVKPEAEAALEARIQKMGFTMGRQLDSVPNFAINGWNSIDRRNLVFNFGARTSYLLTLKVDCPELPIAQSIGFTTTVARLTLQDSLRVFRAGGNMPRYCPIQTITELNRIPRNKG